ncbi:MAG: hypothetical protein IKF52_01290 [Clostridia bacterium]|nr:hypothetical protein [Clostridia bacterium]MBR3152223.1 hypothetical protein [Clostridia bacterium]MBR3152240.1 hypothetical protein [Clostridia bacterium]
MNILNYITVSIIPMVILLIIYFGVSEKKDVFDLFCKGAKEGLFTILSLFPTLLRFVFCY